MTVQLFLLAASLLLVVAEPVSAASPADEDCHDVACWGRKSRAIAQENEQRRAEPVWQQTIAQCTNVARNYDPGFDAHAPTPGRVQMIGTQQGRYQFQKCMGQAGQPTR